jgi:hypothetical protein
MNKGTDFHGSEKQLPSGSGLERTFEKFTTRSPNLLTHYYFSDIFDPKKWP